MRVPNRYVALDVETTGFSPQKIIPWQVQQVHGITNEMLYGEPKPDEVLPEFYKFIAGSILVVHNASFDIRTLTNLPGLFGKKGIIKRATRVGANCHPPFQFRLKAGLICRHFVDN